MSEQARYLSKCRCMWEACMYGYGPKHRATVYWDSYCKREAGYLISGESAAWGAK